MHMLKERPLAFPQDKTLRVILDTDCYNECDDQFCVAHALMTNHSGNDVFRIIIFQTV